MKINFGFIFILPMQIHIFPFCTYKYYIQTTIGNLIGLATYLLPHVPCCMSSIQGERKWKLCYCSSAPSPCPRATYIGANFSRDHAPHVRSSHGDGFVMLQSTKVRSILVYAWLAVLVRTQKIKLET
jgi:hypothetical protein